MCHIRSLLRGDMWKWLSGSSSSTVYIFIPSLTVYFLSSSFFLPAINSIQQQCNYASLNQLHKRGPHVKFRPPRQPLGGKPFAKGVVLKTLIKKPKKPNSANRKCVLVRLSTGKEMVAYVPGIGHNLQEHNVVLCRVGKLQDTPGVKIKGKILIFLKIIFKLNKILFSVVRGAYDCAHVIKPTK